MEDYLLVGQQIFEREPRMTHLAKERASFLQINNIIDILFFGTPDCHHFCSIA
jgi:hypothetical protein